MSKMLKISEAASLALHGMVFLAARPDRLVSIKEMAKVLSVSEAHLSKVFQRLARVGLVKSNRGPRGGFTLGRLGNKITLLQVYEAIEGPLECTSCLFDRPICDNNKCIFGDLLEVTNNRYRAYLDGMKLSEVTDVYEKEKQDA
ncbi:RrF2 family transcriptional regulator [Candidatus Zixiibacteriota bacterium]